VSGEFHPRDFRRSLRGAGLTPTERMVAVELSEYSGIGKAIVWPAVATLAADCGVGRSTVKRALNRLQSKGFTAAIGSRAGGRGHATRWQLLVKGVTSEPLYDAERGSSETERGSSQTIKGSTGEPRSSKEVDKEGGARASAALPSPPAEISAAEQPEPDRYCPAHMPNGTRRNCRACGTAREDNQVWREQQAERRRLQAAAIRQAIADCTRCNGTGSVWVNDDTVRPCQCRGAA
jgi:Helix-turn-helix domain